MLEVKLLILELKALMLLVYALKDDVVTKVLVSVALPVLTVNANVVPLPLVKVIILLETEAVVTAFGVFEAVAAYDALNELEAYDELNIEFAPYGPNTFELVTNDAVAANVLLDAYDALVAKNELDAYDELNILLDPYGPYTLDDVTNDAVPTVSDPVP
jgi:hypothetical protein